MRKTKDVTVTFEGRDKGKTFRITEMSATKAQWWAMRALLAVGNGGLNAAAPDPTTGMAGMFELGLRALFGLPEERARELLDELLACVEFVVDARKNVVRPLQEAGQRDPVNEDIEEPVTRFWLFGEVFELHTGFSAADALSTLASAWISPSPESGDTPTSIPSPGP